MIYFGNSFQLHTDVSSAIVQNTLTEVLYLIAKYGFALQGQLKRVLQSVQAMASPPPSRSNTMERKKVMCILLYSIALWSNHPFDLITKLPFFVKEFRGKSVKKTKQNKNISAFKYTSYFNDFIIHADQKQKYPIVQSTSLKSGIPSEQVVLYL